MKNQLLIELHKQSQTVFSLKEISLLMPDLTYNNLSNQVLYLTKQGAIKRLTRGIYAKDEYNPFELANKLYTPSYISLETVLLLAGITFQHYERIFSMSYLTRTVKVSGHTLQYHQMNKEILLDKRGLVQRDNITIASPERAFLDALYLYKDYHFDNLGALDWDKVFEFVNIYKRKAMHNRVDEYHQIYQEEHIG
jgi:predicted transcriptional regulator of viral defense system